MVIYLPAGCWSATMMLCTYAISMRLSAFPGKSWRNGVNPGGIRNNIRHIWQRRFVRNYHAQNAKKGRPCVIAVTPERVEFLTAEQFG
jgi:hypothetical protein